MFRLDPRGDLPLSVFQPTSNRSRRLSNFLEYDSKRFSTLTNQKPKRKPCYDWIFSSATNVHVAIDKSAFKTYTAFSSYVLTLVDHREIHVRGIGSVELKIRCRPGAKESRTITLGSVLHVPDWYCNIFSDTYFVSSSGFDYTWTTLGISFVKKDRGKMRFWGYTESFCGLDRFVLASKSEGYSPMLEDRDREVFTINLTWPQSQRNRWKATLALQMKQAAKPHEQGVVASSTTGRESEGTEDEIQDDTKQSKETVSITTLSPASRKVRSFSSMSHRKLAGLRARSSSSGGLLKGIY